MDVFGIHIFFSGYTEPNARRISKIQCSEQGKKKSKCLNFIIRYLSLKLKIVMNVYITPTM